MKTVTIYTDGKAGFAALKNVPTRSPLHGNRSGMTTEFESPYNTAKDR